MYLVYPTIFYRTIFLIDLFSLYVLFSLSDHVTVPQRVSFKYGLLHVHRRAYACIVNEKKKANSLENITWSELGKQNILAKRFFSAGYYSSQEGAGGRGFSDG